MHFFNESTQIKVHSCQNWWLTDKTKITIGRKERSFEKEQPRPDQELLTFGYPYFKL
jgi:hypothetical protein